MEAVFLEVVGTVIVTSAISLMRPSDGRRFFLTGRATAGAISIRSDVEDDEVAIVTFPRGVSTWDTAEPITSTAEDASDGRGILLEHDDHANREDGHNHGAASVEQRSTKLVGLLPELAPHERTLGDRTTRTLAGHFLGKYWLTEPTYLINLETELLRGLRNQVSDDELTLVRLAVSGETEPRYQQALQSALARMQDRFDAYQNPTVENFVMLNTEEQRQLHTQASSAASEPPIDDTVHLGEFSFRWDDLVKSPHQEIGDSSTGNVQPPSEAEILSEPLTDPSTRNEDDDLLEF